MLIILEGPDGAGKSTLADMLREELEQRLDLGANDVRMLHSSVPMEHPLDEYVMPLVDYRPESGEHIICDRWHWGEWVYPRVLRRDTSYNPGVHYYTELFLQSRGAIVVHVSDDVATLKQRIEERGDWLIKPSQLSDLRSGFFDLMQRNTILNGMSVVSSGINGTTIDKIITMAAQASRACHVINRYVTYVGHPRPNVLLFGDVRGKEIDWSNERPAFMPYGGTSGGYLLSTLARSTFKKELRIGIANACDVDSPESVWRDTGFPQIVALGNNARMRLDKLKYRRVRFAPHPQFVRRFHNRRVDEYYDQLVYGVEASWR